MSEDGDVAGEVCRVEVAGSDESFERIECDVTRSYTRSAAERVVYERQRCRVDFLEASLADCRDRRRVSEPRVRADEPGAGDIAAFSTRDASPLLVSEVQPLRGVWVRSGAVELRPSSRSTGEHGSGERGHESRPQCSDQSPRDLGNRKGRSVVRRARSQACSVRLSAARSAAPDVNAGALGRFHRVQALRAVGRAQKLVASEPELALSLEVVHGVSLELRVPICSLSTGRLVLSALCTRVYPVCSCRPGVPDASRLGRVS